MDNNSFSEKELKLSSVPNLSLAYLGDSVFEVLVRYHLVASMEYNPRELHNAALKFVSAPAQAEAIIKIMPFLTDDEKTVYKRGRNTKVHSVPRNATIEQYHTATGLETLFGYLYITKQNERIDELFNIILGE